jgi:CRISPR type IV-associated protein Csf1
MLVCPSCEAINRKPFLGKGFVLTEKQVTLIYDKAVPEWDLPSVDIMPRNELWEVLLAPPKPPFVISLAVDKQYTLQHAIVNYSRDKFFVNKGVSKIAFSTNDLRNAAAETAKKIYDNPLTQWFLRQQLKSVLTSVASAPEPIAVLPLKKAKKSIKEECVAKAVACA